MQHPLKDFSQKSIEAAIGGALCQLTGASYTADIKSIESLELTLDERNRHITYGRSQPVLVEKDRIVVILNRHSLSANQADQEETSEITMRR
jgi:hypothetical protein